MKKYELRFWFEHGGFCIWGMNAAAKDNYGYAIETGKIPISLQLKSEIDSLEAEYGTYLNWNDPLDDFPWSKEQKASFISRANQVYEKLVFELGDEYEVSNEIESCVI